MRDQLDHLIALSFSTPRFPDNSVPYSGPVYIGLETDSRLKQNAILEPRVLREVTDVGWDRSRNRSPATTFVVDQGGSNAEGDPSKMSLSYVGPILCLADHKRGLNCYTEDGCERGVPNSMRRPRGGNTALAHTERQGK